MESEQHLLNLSTLELIRIIQEQKDEIERLEKDIKAAHYMIHELQYGE